MSKQALSFVGGAVILVFLVGWIAFKSPVQAPSGESTGKTVSEEDVDPARPSPPPPAAATQPPGTSGPKPTPAPAPVAAAPLSFVAPMQGAEWVLGIINRIQWNKEAGVTGGIALLDGQTKAVLGWIAPNLGPHQTSYSWDTRSVQLSRTSGLTKDVGVGTYLIRIVFDGRYASIESGTVSIIYPAQAKTETHTLSIANFAFNAKTIIVRKGDDLVIANNDSVSHRIRISALSPVDVAPGSSVAFDTYAFAPGSYEVYSTEYSSLVATLVVQ